MAAIRDIEDRARARHPAGATVLAIAARGEVELGIPPQGSLADLHGQLGGDLAQQIQALHARPGVVGLHQLARVSEVTFPSSDLYPGNYVEGFDRAWQAVASSWKTHLGRLPGWS